MGGFQFRSSLKKWPARKASGPERHPFDSAEPIITLLTSRIWMFCWLVPWKITAVPVTTWHDVVCKKGAGRQHTTFTSCQNAACSNEFFLWRVDYDWANVHYFCLMFHTERSWNAAYWQIKSRIWEMKGGKYTKTLAKILVEGIFRIGDIRGYVLPKFIELCMETPCWSSSG